MPGLYRWITAAALTIVAPVNAATQDGPTRNPYGATPGAIEAPARDGEVGTSAELVEKVAAFVTSFYLSGEDLTAEQMAVLYAPRVDYFGDRDRSRASVIRDKLAYFRRWPQRTYTLVPDTLMVSRVPGSDALVQATFEYEFDVSSRQRRSAGRGRAELVLDLGVEGGAIASEGGVVLDRR